MSPSFAGSHRHSHIYKMGEDAIEGWSPSNDFRGRCLQLATGKSECLTIACFDPLERKCKVPLPEGVCKRAVSFTQSKVHVRGQLQRSGSTQESHDNRVLS